MHRLFFLFFLTALFVPLSPSGYIAVPNWWDVIHKRLKKKIADVVSFDSNKELCFEIDINNILFVSN